ncbi:MAG: hypothetical protein LBH90_05685 [Tannerella sp.]|nr:hypothetical protein [Tannerella sp.]
MQIKLFKITVCCILLLSGCGKTEQARTRLQQAEQLYETQQYGAAKNAIDTLRALYPREIEVLKDALTLMRMVERGESERNITFCDSLTPLRMEEAEQLKAGFIFEKDSAFEDIGNYVWKQRIIEQNVERSYIRCGVNEKGEIYLASVYFGSKPVNHTGLKLSTSDGLFAETAAVPYDGGMNYRFRDMGNTTEVVTYKGENCRNAVAFVYSLDEKARIKVEYTGGSKYSLYLSDNDKKAIRATYDLSVVLSDIEIMRREKEKLTRKIMYLDAKLKGEPASTH